MMLLIRRFLIPIMILVILSSGTIELCGQTYSYNIRLAVHIVRNSQGDYGIPVSEVETSIQQVNNVFTLYNSTDIHFTMSYPDYIDDDYYTTGTKLNLIPIGYSFSQKTTDLFDKKNEPGVIHIYYIKKEFTTGMVIFCMIHQQIPLMTLKKCGIGFQRIVNLRPRVVLICVIPHSNTQMLSSII